MALAQAAPQEQQRPRSRPLLAISLLVIGCALLLLVFVLSVSVGAADISLETVWRAVFDFNSDLTQHQVIRQLRLPRAVIGAIAGACLAISGAVMQGMTRNPLASPGLVGVSTGSAFFIVLAFAFLPNTPYLMLMILSFAGAFFGTALVYGVAALGRGGLTPVGIALSGAAVSALLGAVTSGVSIYYQLQQDLMFWYAGGVAGVKWLHVNALLPWFIAGFLAAIALSPSITVLNLGEEVARGLGMRTARVKAAGSIVVFVLTGAAISTAGSVGFVGLIVPHITRYLIGVDYRWVIPCSAVLGGLLVMLADIASRMVNPPFETPLGIFTALVGVPFFLYLARREKGGV